MYKVENVPLPAVVKRKGPGKGPFRKTIEGLQVGQSFVAGKVDKAPSIRATGYAIASQAGIKLSIRTEGDSIRIYRVE